MKSISRTDKRFVLILKLCVVTAFFSVNLPSFANQPVEVEIECPAPTNVSYGTSGNSVSLNWTGAFGSTAYSVKCFNQETGALVQAQTTNCTNATFYNLSAGTKYSVYLSTVCGGGNSVEIVIVDVML
ncbi:MAG: fibronectin type III domain-containing protein [Saprospiraceae bacterium]|nr:fibronectin type III domain-containing protein [Saprospiraceae bacterium]